MADRDVALLAADWWVTRGVRRGKAFVSEGIYMNSGLAEDERDGAPGCGAGLTKKLPEPEPSAGIAAYRRERELALAASQPKRDNYERYLRRQIGASVDYLPIKLDIENVSRCNFKCTMCMVSDWDKGRRAADMSLDDFKRLIDEQIGLVEIKLQGIGEPLLQGDTFFDMVRYARARHIWVRTTTNASLLHLKDNCRKLIDADPNEIQISIDGATKEVFESVRRGGVFERVIENCKAINAYSREKGVVRTKMWTVVQKANRHQLRDLVLLGAELGFEHMCLSLDISDWGQSEWHDRNGSVSVDAVSFDDARALMDLGAANGIKVGFWEIAAKYSRERLCPWPFERLFVSSDMRLVPCCMIANPEVFDLGDGRELTEAWQGERYNEFRRSHLDGDLPHQCRGCYS